MFFREEIGESLTLKFAQAAAERRKMGLPIISLGLGEPDFAVPQEIISATIEVLTTSHAKYSSPMGLPSFREKLAAKLQSENRIPANPDNLLVTPGAKQALQFALMALLEPDDEVIIVNPSFVSFIPQVYIAEPRAKIRVLNVKKSDFSISIDKLKELIGKRTKLILLNSPNNPAGYMLSKKEQEEIFNLAVANDCYIISDELYEKLVFSNLMHHSIGSFENKVDRVITVNGFSKSHSMTGWRLGYLCFPKPLQSKINKLQQHINTNTCTFIQQAMDKAFDHDYTYLKDYNNKLAERAKTLAKYFSKIDNVSLYQPSAGFFAFLNISGLGVDSNTFCSKLIQKTGVATTPGIAFGEDWDDHIRISFATDDELLNKGLALIKQFILNDI